ncbi:MAG TPA: MgtC/SapB family protein [Candidatus Ratteibacteria bacterium]|nr:MgtC/SapB family protein [bacterium]HPC28703.1 MgtC/SapB family protein [bacterium]HRS05808.1 MgtC/SapB family protein [Candidatus Ratteibacteria bacterium]HRV03812.1 MgtC/SapB family protein [Candidatus Ratteibacteria bacterium]
MITELEWLLRIFVAGILSGIVGWEREKHARAAGFRTLILVGMGCCLSMIVSLRIPELFSESTSYYLRIDPARIAYGVLTGIGFIGAGTIIKDRGSVRGLTTASCLWGVSTIGLAIGCGYYFLGISTTVLIMITLLTLRTIELKIPRDVYSRINIKFSEEDPKMLKEIFNEIENMGYKILEFSISELKDKKVYTAEIQCISTNEKDGITVLQGLKKFEKIIEIDFR